MIIDLKPYSYLNDTTINHGRKLIMFNATWYVCVDDGYGVEI